MPYSKEEISKKCGKKCGFCGMLGNPDLDNLSIFDLITDTHDLIKDELNNYNLICDLCKQDMGDLNIADYLKKNKIRYKKADRESKKRMIIIGNIISMLNEM